MPGILISAATALTVCGFILSFSRRLGSLTEINPGGHWSHQQNDVTVPRIGGLAVMTAMMTASWLTQSHTAWGLLAVAMLVFTAGFAEDLTGRVGPVERYVMALIAGLFAYLFMEVRIERLDLPLLDSLLGFWPPALVLTVFAVASFTHAMNLLDGLHGLSAGTAALALMGTAVLAQTVGDVELAQAGWVMAGALLGFLLVNFPWGRLFLGDGGAYLCGSVMSCLAILLVRRNEDVSPWFALALLAHPVAETVLTVARRAALHRSPLGAPDIFHVHSLLYQLLLRRLSGRKSSSACNALAALMLLVVNAGMVALAVWQYQNTDGLMIQCATFAAFYAGAWYWLMHHAALESRAQKSDGRLAQR